MLSLEGGYERAVAKSVYPLPGVDSSAEGGLSDMAENGLSKSNHHPPSWQIAFLLIARNMHAIQT